MLKKHKTSIAKLFLAAVIATTASIAPVFAQKAQAQTTCNIISVGFSNAGFYGIPYADLATEIQESGMVYEENLIQPDGNGNIKTSSTTVTVKSEGCYGKDLRIQITGNLSDDAVIDALTYDFRQANQNNGEFKFNYVVGEDNCSAGRVNNAALSYLGAVGWTLSAINEGVQAIGNAVGSAKYDCKHSVKLYEKINGSWSSLTPSNGSKNFLYFECVNNTEYLLSTFLNYENRCKEFSFGQGSDDTNWSKGTAPTGVNLIDISGNTVQGTEMQFDPNSPCYDNDPASKTYQKLRPGCNELLAPLPGLPAAIDKDVSLGQYLNTLFRLIIGVLTAIAVVMLIVIGIQYMTIGSVTGKIDAKKKIQNILLGLLVALGIFTILSTINPNLLNLQPNIDNVSILAADYGTQTAAEQSQNNGQGIKGACPEQIINLSNNVTNLGSNKILRPADGAINSSCAWRAFEGGQNHPGIDISGVNEVSVVKAAAGGTIERAVSSCPNRRDDNCPKKGQGQGYGNNIIINHGNGVYTLYGHLATLEPGITKGATVTQGQALGKIGTSGHSSGGHLHFELISGGQNGTRINPATHF